MDYSKIPVAMQAYPNWILWRQEDHGREKPTKVPYAAKGSYAKSNDASTWASFDEALTTFRRGGFNGLGFVFEGTRFVGVDIDGCFNPESGEFSTEALDVVHRLNSYTERSQSGKGFHIIMEGKLPSGRRKNGAFEMYGKGSPRYFAMTGDVWDGLTEIRADQAAIDEVHRRCIQPQEKPQPVEPAGAGACDLFTEFDDDETLLAKARKDGLFETLFSGNWQGKYKSQSEADMALADKLAFWCGREIEQMDRIFRRSGLYREKWDRPQSGSTYGFLTLEKAAAECRQTYNPRAYFEKRVAREVTGRGQERRTLADLHPENNDRYGWNDIGNGNLFADWFKDRARFVPDRNKWFVFSGKVWRADVGGLMAMQLAKKLADLLMVYALSIEEEKLRRSYMEFAARWQKRSYRETILKDAAGVYPIPFSTFDRNPMIFNCLNGTRNFETGEFYKHRPEDFLSKLAGVNFDPSARCERWERFITEVMQGDKEKARFLQKALGYSLTGDTKHECFFILYGPLSRNGKGTTMETYMCLMGDYGCAAKPDTIAQKQAANGSGPSEDIARLVGARFVNISEPDKRLVLSAALVKTLTGRDTINARFLHENSFEFRPDFKLFINTNYLPQVTDVTLFSSGRVKVIPFERHFEDDEQDKGLKGELAKSENLSGILNWCIEGLNALKEDGFESPASVETATAEYRQRSDKMGRFVAEELEAGSLYEVRTGEVYDRYRAWCLENGFHPENAANFKQGISKFGEVKYKRPLAAPAANPSNYFVGYKLTPKVTEYMSTSGWT